MPKGKTWPSEYRTFKDHLSGAEITQLTNYKAHTHHLYFTNPGWYDGGKRMLIASDRDNRTNLCSLELATGEITQLTDLEPDQVTSFLATTVNPVRDEAYFFSPNGVMALDLGTMELRELCDLPEGFRRSMINCAADGKHLCAGIFEDLSDRLRIDYGHGYVGFRETCEAKPESRILRVATDGSGAEVIWQEQCWIGHVNTSPTQPNVLTFCHEGPWDMVDNRIWGMDITEGKPWKIRPCTQEGERVGHEYWYADGETLGFHGSYPDGRGFFGKIRYDNTDRVEVDFPHETGHIHSNDISLVVGDARPYIRMWKWTGETFDGPRVLAEHRSSMYQQIVHAHPRFTPDGSKVVYTSDVSGYGNVYLAQVPEFESLPPVPES